MTFDIPHADIECPDGTTFDMQKMGVCTSTTFDIQKLNDIRPSTVKENECQALTTFDIQGD